MATDQPRLDAAFRTTPDRTTGLSGLLGSAPAEPEAPLDEERSSAAPRPAAPPSDPPADDEVQRSEANSLENRAEPAQASSTTDRHETPRRRGRRAPVARRSRQVSSPAGAGEAAPEDIPRVVPLVLDVAVLSRLREHGRQSGMTHGLIVLAAIENHIDELPRRWSSADTRVPSKGLFGRTQPQHRRTEPGVQTQVRLAAGDADVLKYLVGQWSAPLRSALVIDALILELGTP